MALSKRLMKTDWARNASAWLGALYVRLVVATTRWTVEMPAEVERMAAEGRPYIVAFWHGRLLLMSRAWTRQGRFHMLITEHRDGALISGLIAHLGFPTVGGSSKKGWLAALRSLQRLLAAGDCVGITPDGPRGPRMRAKIGVIKTAQWTGVPILPLTYSVRRRIIVGSWDRFCLALPFSRGVIAWGEPLSVPRDAEEETLERCRGELENRLNVLTAAADRACGHAQVEPAPYTEAVRHDVGAEISPAPLAERR